MQSDQYKENLIEALHTLVRVNESIFDSMVGIHMQGEMKDWNDSVPIGETHEFTFELFKNSNDVNIQLLVKLIEAVDDTFHTLKNINNLQTED